MTKNVNALIKILNLIFLLLYNYNSDSDISIHDQTI